MSYLVVFVGAGIGGAARHGMNIWVARVLGSHFPWHTLVINILGSIVMGPDHGLVRRTDRRGRAPAPVPGDRGDGRLHDLLCFFARCRAALGAA
jgi:hypothetical protein